MKLLNCFSLLVAGSMLAACGEVMDDTDLPPDSEHGLETLDGKDDSFAVRPGSPEADAVVRYVNREIANDAEGVAFRDEIDAKLHAWSARNIAEFRAGADGAFGTADDRVFADIAAVDRVPWVGRAALMQLFQLAEAAGFFQRASVDCADFVEHDRWNNYYISSYARLLEYENSGCTTITGNLYIQISGTDLLPPSARAIRQLRHLRTINGNLQITTSNHFTSIHFDSLETVTGSVRAESPTGRKHTLEFSALASAKSIYLSAIQSSLFPALEQNDDITLMNTDYEGFTALKHAKKLAITHQTNGTWNIAFPALTEVGDLSFNVPRPNSWTAADVTFTGGFDKLEKGGSISMANGKYAQLGFPSLIELDSLSTAQTVDPYLGMSKLATVRSYYSSMDEFASGVHQGPAALANVGNMTVTSQSSIKGYDALESVDRDITITANGGVEGFNALTMMGGSIKLTVGRVRAQLNLTGFNKLSHLDTLTISANHAPVVIGPLFEALENTGGQVSLIDNGEFFENPVFKKLLGIGGGLRVDVLMDGVDMMPSLEIVDGHVAINRTPVELTGFPNLERIEGSLTLRSTVSKLTGMSNLSAVGGNLSVPRTLPNAELDAFLNRLTEFSGTINYN